MSSRPIVSNPLSTNFASGLLNSPFLFSFHNNLHNFVFLPLRMFPSYRIFLSVTVLSSSQFFHTLVRTASIITFRIHEIVIVLLYCLYSFFHYGVQCPTFVPIKHSWVNIRPQNPQPHIKLEVSQRKSLPTFQSNWLVAWSATVEWKLQMHSFMVTSATFVRKEVPSVSRRDFPWSKNWFWWW